MTAALVPRPTDSVRRAAESDEEEARCALLRPALLLRPCGGQGLNLEGDDHDHLVAYFRGTMEVSFIGTPPWEGRWVAGGTPPKIPPRTPTDTPEVWPGGSSEICVKMAFEGWHLMKIPAGGLRNRS